MAHRSRDDVARRTSTKPKGSRKNGRTDTKEAATEALKPDVSELRRLREAYFGRKSSHTVKVRAARSSAGTTRTRSGQETGRRSTKTQSSAGSRQRKDRKVRVKHRDKTTEYVYQNHRVAVSRPPEIAQSSRSSWPELTDKDVSPDDSISQVATRSSRRTTFKRTSLRAIPEKSSVQTVPNTSAAKGKRTSSFWGSIFSRQTPSSTVAAKTVECLTCGTDDVLAAKAIKLSCGHQMCHSCLRRVFKLAVHDPAHMPPKCCTSEPIPLKRVGPLFDLRFKVLFNKKLDEYNTKNRIYCPNRRCGVWIRPAAFVTSGGRKYARCTRCGTKACIHCSQKLHKSPDCPKDPEIVRLVEQAEQRGWKRCYNCNAMVELKEGCNHMTCRCMAEFCMVCGSQWKTCDCPWFSQTNLPNLDRLNEMMVPQPIEVVVRRVRTYLNEMQPRADQRPEQRVRVGGYRHELDERRRQEREDEELARRMQLADLV